MQYYSLQKSTQKAQSRFQEQPESEQKRYNAEKFVISLYQVPKVHQSVLHHFADAVSALLQSK